MKVSVFILASALSLSFGGYAQQTDQKQNKAEQKKEAAGRSKGHADPNLEQGQSDDGKKDAAVKDRSSGAVMRYTIVVKGKVQDVGFRNAAKLKARSLDLRGEARNESDGSVYIEVEGPKSKLDEFVEFCKVGPDQAEVRDVNVKKSTQLKDFKEFDVDRLTKDGEAPGKPMQGETPQKK